MQQQQSERPKHDPGLIRDVVEKGFGVINAVTRLPESLISGLAIGGYQGARKGADENYTIRPESVATGLVVSNALQSVAQGAIGGYLLLGPAGALSNAAKEAGQASFSTYLFVIGSVPYELVRKMRASFNVIGPLAMICGWARVGKPGGCNIGQRPVDFHLKGLEAFGFKISEEHGDVLAMIPSEFKKEIIYTLPFPSVGATEQLMTTASLMSGTHVIIENAAREPEITDLQGFLNSCGARVSGASTPTIEVYGVSNLHGCDYSVIPDRIEAGTYLLGALTTKGDITIKGARYDHIISLISVLEEMGAGVEKGNDFVRGFWKGPLKPVTVSSEPYPGFPTDLQPLLTSVLATVEGTSILEENVFENRFGYVDELNRMGAKIKVSSRQAFIVGVHRLSGAEVVAPDIRAGAALVMAGLAADGETIINNVTHIFRGYERFQEKLSRLGAKIAYYDDR